MPYKLLSYQSGRDARAGVLVGETVYDAAKAHRRRVARERDRHPRRLVSRAAAPRAGGEANRVGQKAGPRACRSRVPGSWRPCSIRATSIAPAPTTPTTWRRWRAPGPAARAHHERARREALALREVVAQLRRGAGCPGQGAGLLADDRLGGRARRGHRQGRARRSGGKGARLRGRLHDRRRSLGARRDETRQEPADLPFHYDWLSQKCFDGSCPLGPWIVPAGDIKDPQNLALKLWVNDTLMQDSNTSRMIFDTAEQIAMLSSRVTLQPGDLVLTGTPAGVACRAGCS